MTDATNPAEEDAPPKKKSKALLFGLIGAIVLGGGTFYGVYSGLVPLPFGGDEKVATAGKEEAEEKEDPYSNPATMAAAFVPLEEMVISLGPDAKARHLQVKVSIEVEPGSELDVQTISPRITDVLNTYLRAIKSSDLENPRSMTRMRAQMLRRVRLVAPQGAVRDVLIQHFVLN